MASGLGGGLGSQRGELPLMADVNVTSLVDVMLVLLIVFMITAPMMQGGVDVELPRAEARPLSPKEGMVVSVNRDGRIFVDQTPVSYRDFRVTFKSLVATRKPSGVYLQADTRVPYGEVVRVLAIIRGAGVQNVGPGRAGGRAVVNLRAPDRGDPRSKLAGWIGTLVVHAGAALFLVSQVRTTTATPPVYAVNLVAAPAPTERRRIAREAIPTPPQEKPAPVKPSPKPPPKAPPKPEPKPSGADPARPGGSRRPTAGAGHARAEGETPSTGTDVVTIKTPGLEFPYPEYLRNIVNQIYPRWDREDARGNRFAEISFLIRRDGSVHDIRFVTRSGSFAFDLSAQGAIEAAGNALAFGQLPDGWEADVLPVSFYFKPADQ